MINYGICPITGESYAETDEFSLLGSDWLVRMTAKPPYKDYANNKDELLVSIDFHIIGTGEKGRWDDIWLPARLPQDNFKRRYSLYRTLPNLKAQVEPVPSPIYAGV
jgi:hypothetical protein